jgi:diaminopimelate dehydrogenase
MTPQFARDFHVVDSFDNHADVPKHFAAVNQAAEEGGRIAIISAGWDPGLFSVQRLVGSAIIPQGRVYTFWGAGISQGHSQAIRRVSGVLDARQYTIPNAEILQRVRAGENLSPIPQEMHKRRCIVVAEQGADRSTIETEIKTMPNYFAGYDTTVEFVDEQTLLREHGTLPHGGCVICADGGKVIDFHLKVDSNPNFTASVLVTCARAAVRMAERGETGCKTLLDVPPADLSPLSREELYRKFV